MTLRRELLRGADDLCGHRTIELLAILLQLLDLGIRLRARGTIDSRNLREPLREIDPCSSQSGDNSRCIGGEALCARKPIEARGKIRQRIHCVRLSLQNAKSQRQIRCGLRTELRAHRRIGSGALAL